MLKNRSLRTAALAVSLGLAPSALAAAETPQADRPYIFETVDSYNAADATHFEITGILRGESTPRTLRFRIVGYSEPSVHMSRCDRLALLAMTRPGAWFLEVSQAEISSAFPSCKLTRR